MDSLISQRANCGLAGTGLCYLSYQGASGGPEQGPLTSAEALSRRAMR
jgi:hypothetical protein